MSTCIIGRRRAIPVGSRQEIFVARATASEALPCHSRLHPDVHWKPVVVQPMAKAAMRTIGLLAFLMVVAVSCHQSLRAQELAPVKDLPHTIGSASRTHGPLMFCALPDAGVIPPAYAAASKSGTRPFVVGWHLQVDPPRSLGKVLLITNLPPIGSLTGANCKRVQPLPPGGVGAMQLYTPYAAVDKAGDWAQGYTSLVMTAKNDALPADDYVPRLKRHVKLVTQLFEPRGMDGYLVYAGDDFEWAYLHWVSQEASQKAFAAPEGRTGPQDSASFQHVRGTSVQIFPGGLGK